MLAHPDCEDPDRLLISARLNASWWAADDLYTDDTALGPRRRSCHHGTRACPVDLGGVCSVEPGACLIGMI